MIEPVLYLLDTNIISGMMRNPRGIANKQLASRIAKNPELRLCISNVVDCEVHFGLRRKGSSKLDKAYAELLQIVEILPLDLQVTSPYANLRTQIEAAGTPIGANDTLIADHALALAATLVSGDAIFTRAPGLQVENWLQPL